MADISISPINNVNTASAPVRNNTVRNINGTGAARGVQPSAGAKAAEQAKEAVEAQKERSAEVRREQLEDVIAVSKDGDTVQATDKSLERLKEDAFGHMEVRKDQTETGEAVNGQAETGANINGQTEAGEVTGQAMEESAETAAEGTESRQAIQESIEKSRLNGSRTEEAIEDSVERAVNGVSRTEEAIELGNRRAEQEEAEKEYNQKLTSYQGISDMKLEQMYLQGEISKTDYDQEMASREEARETEAEDNARFGNQMAGAAVLQESGQRDLNQIETAFSGEANNTISAADRMEIIETLDTQTALNINNQASANMVTDENASGEETVKRVVFS
ncbi:MAG: hypothetical protein IJT24_05395 [Lachnospiraceae bacterium]|nr:hypothetical protein [Lachnospiraceae bacterium]